MKLTAKKSREKERKVGFPKWKRKRPTESRSYSEYFICPRCGAMIEPVYASMRAKKCPHCGQRLKWY